MPLQFSYIQLQLALLSRSDVTNINFRYIFFLFVYLSVSQSFLASAPFPDQQISIAPLPCEAHISTQFLGIVHLVCLKMIKIRMNAKMHFTIKLNLVKR